MTEEFMLSAISTVGFPIAAFMLMWHTHNNTLKQLTDAINNLVETVKKE